MREHLTPNEVEALAVAARKRGRYGQRDAFAIRFAARHGFRVSELCALRWDQIDLDAGLMHVHRLKAGEPSTHTLKGDEIRALRQLRRDWPEGRFVFVTASAARRSRGPDLRRWSSSQVRRPGSSSRCTSTCSGTPAATNLPTMDRTLGHCSCGSGTRQYSTR
jgi:integrase